MGTSNFENSRQVHGDRGAGSDPAFGGNFAAGLLNDRVNVRKTEPRPLGFCRKEWLENSSENLRRHSATCVRYSEADTLSHTILVRRFDPKLSAVRHGVARIQ